MAEGKEGTVVQPRILLPDRRGPDATYLHELDVMYGALSLIPELIADAREERKQNGVSHRRVPFTVGAAGVGLDADESGLHVFYGANRKVNRYNETVCAEKKLLGRARKASMSRLVLIVIAATTDLQEIKGVTGRLSPTLPPCEARCVPMFRDSPLVDARTLYLAIGHEASVAGDRYQVHTQEDLEDFYLVDPPLELAQIPFYDGHDDAWRESLTAFVKMKETAEAATPGSRKRRPATKLALDALRLPDRERRFIMDQMSSDPRYHIYSRTPTSTQ